MTEAVARLVVVGANHRSSSMMLRDRLFVEEAAVPAFLHRLRDKGLDQAVALSTCDRVEVQAIHPDPAIAHRLIVEALAVHAGLQAGDLEGQVYGHQGPAALRQLFAVTASLDSLMIGEPQVLGQVKDAHRLARDAGMVGPEMEALLQAAYAAAKRVRSETAIGEGPVSIAAAAVQLARDVHGDLDRCRGLLIGGGDMGELVAQDLVAGGLAHLSVTHPLESRGEAVARQLGCHHGAFSDLDNLLAEADVVLTSLGTRRHAVTAGMMAQALKHRRRKPVFLVDTGIPGDVDPATGKLDGAFLYDLNDLERVAMEGRAGRESQARDAWRILDEELAAFQRGRAERAAVPALIRLRAHVETLREAALRDAGGDADKATRLLASRLLHDPSEVMRHAAGAGGEEEWRAMEDLLARLFRLEDQ
ncbi:MAG: glutamyl-tRNA reductase [Magnetospirillum sp. WYHS-4]